MFGFKTDRATSAVLAAAAVVAVACFTTGAHAVALPDPMFDPPLSKTSTTESIVLSGGCFWGVQAVFQHVKGVTKVVSGYAGGGADTATYDRVSTGTTGHAESVEVTYDTSQVTLGQLLKVFFSVAHDPTQVDAQGPDHGTQYRSAIFYTNAAQQRIADTYIDQLQQTNIYPRAIATQVKPLQGFYPAEDYHQNYATLHPNNPYIVRNDAPKVMALQNMLPQLYVQP